ncbi:flagellar basal body P-ring biosynthesis protein FlgA [Brachybacterium phenoliresistens]|uniref:Flagellar basal body P-ring biosynthesis protein FlgA n=1 Tax=Brachybacterium phenoliresistens TaxID=396014 RepID=Z9JSM6_9MICO|nr:SAF domain-containing protein [Brachybacterium phenoliresistens]EWS80811.1 flagellar basal body P-ring biosynthesis protein FlgA [Brachybacterium phenoliresistens]
MTDAAPAPATMRLRRPRWKDPRLVVGIALVLLSILLGSVLVSRLAETTTVLAARVDIVPGDVITADKLTSVDVRLGELEGLYVRDLEAIPEGSVAMQTVRSGELLTVSAVGQGTEVPLRPVVLPVEESVAQSVAPGGQVELWRTREGIDGAPPTAELLIDSAVVRRVDEGSAIGMRSMTVEVLVPAEDVPLVLEALAEDARLDVIGVPGAQGARS